LLSFGCHGEVEELALAPQLLHDEAEMAAYLEAFPYDRFQISEVPNLGKFYIDDNPTLVKKKLRSGRPWEPHLIREFEEHVVPGTTALDVGAHIGSLTVPLARLVGPEGRVYAFEPQKHVYRELVHNLRPNELTNAIPLRFAVSSEPRIIEMTPVVIDDGWVRIGEGGDKAEARTIDSFGFFDVSVIKIDVELHEVEVLKGAEETITTFHPVIFVEIGRQNLKVVKTMLAGWGYSLRRLPPWADYIAVFEASPKAKSR
jgi:FkbM family methyltransferase